MVVVVDVPDVDRGAAVAFGGPLAGVEELFGQGAVVALKLSVVLGRVRPDVLVLGRRSQDGAVEVLGAVGRPVVGHDPGDSGDAVGGEERLCACPESDGGGGSLVGEGFGVGEAGEAVDGGVQVDVSGPGALGFGPVDGLGLG